MKRFEEYTDVEKDELRKQGLRVLTHAYKFQKHCALCKWSNPAHLWLSTIHSHAAPLARIPQAQLLTELSTRTIMCALCRRSANYYQNVPQKEWTTCVKQIACIGCGLPNQDGWICVTDQCESKRCIACHRAFRARVQAAKELNKQCKLAAKQCAMCLRAVRSTGSQGFDWDHLDRCVKSGNIGRMTMDGEPLDLIRAEIAKCRLLCVYCHLDWTSRQLGYCDPVPKILEALEKARIRTFNETTLDLCDSDSSSDKEE